MVTDYPDMILQCKIAFGKLQKSEVGYNIKKYRIESLKYHASFTCIIFIYIHIHIHTYVYIYIYIYIYYSDRLQFLNLHSLSQRQTIAYLTQAYKIIKGFVDVPV